MTWRHAVRYVSGWLRWWAWVVGGVGAWLASPPAPRGRGGRARALGSSPDKYRGH